MSTSDKDRLRDERARVSSLIDTLEVSRLHSRDAGVTATRIVELRRKLADIDGAISAPEAREVQPAAS